MTRRRLRPTSLLQVIVLLASLSLFVGIALMALPGAPVWALVVVAVAWVTAFDLYLLPLLLERWAVRWAERSGGILRSRLLTYDADAEDARQREERRADVKDNP